MITKQMLDALARASVVYRVGDMETATDEKATEHLRALHRVLLAQIGGAMNIGDHAASVIYEWLHHGGNDPAIIAEYDRRKAESAAKNAQMMERDCEGSEKIDNALSGLTFRTVTVDNPNYDIIEFSRQQVRDSG